MFTNNYIAYRHNFFFSMFSTGTSGGVTGKKVKDATGASFSMYSQSSGRGSDIGCCMATANCQAIPTSKESSESSVDYGVYFGAGSTPATRDDYTLESPITSGLSISTTNKVISNDGNGKYTVSAFYVVKNTTSEDLNIYEMGCFTPIMKASSEYYAVMMDRTVLSEPITIKAGETKVVTYSIVFNHILNVEA